MSNLNNNLENKQDNLLVVKYEDNNSYQIVKYVINMMVIILLLWYCVRTILFYNNHGYGCKHHSSYKIEGMDASPVASLPVPVPTTVSNPDIGDEQDVNAKIIAMGGASGSDNTNQDALQAATQNTGVGNLDSDQSVAGLLQMAAVTTPNYTKTDENYKSEPLAYGLYGDVPTYLFNDFDDQYTSVWKQPSKAVYVPNAKEYWKASETPRENVNWIKYESDMYTPAWFPGAYDPKDLNH